MKWIPTQLPHNQTLQQLANDLSTEQPFPIALANILMQRGITTYQQAKNFFVPQKTDLYDPFLMKGMKEATERVLQAKRNHEKVLIYGDYDVDGTTSVALMSLFLQDWKVDFEFYIPDRYTEGYGISFKGIDYAKKIDAKVIISLDCGIKANDKVAYSNEQGIDFIICDHHTPGAELPEALAVLDPLRPDCTYPYKDLSGCGVGLKLAVALTKTFHEAGFELPSPDYDVVDKYCDLVTLSIACDLVSIAGENRILAHYGLRKLRTNPSEGIKAIMNLSKIERKWDINDLVFFVGPRINSAGRLSHAKDAVEVLLGRSEFLSNLASDLHDANDERRNIDTETTTEAVSFIEGDAEYKKKVTTVLYNPNWHKGVIGIVASRLIEKYYRPTILFTLSDGKLVGSARSVAGFDLYAALEQCSEHLVQFGGHKYA
ncbi:MAG: single-stranded-DNA-specific exonuclease RecJ, partial [Bacteroidia bacterium]